MNRFIHKRSPLRTWLVFASLLVGSRYPDLAAVILVIALLDAHCC